MIILLGLLIIEKLEVEYDWHVAVRLHGDVGSNIGADALKNHQIDEKL
jgi:hypothetical protein